MTIENKFLNYEECQSFRISRLRYIPYVWPGPPNLDRAGILVNRDGYLRSIGLDAAIAVIEFQDQPIALALEDFITPGLALLREAAGVHGIGPVIKRPE